MNMIRPAVPPATTNRPLALLFTNASGLVVFADRNYLRLTKQSAEQVVFWQSLATTLTVDAQLAKGFISLVTQNEYLDRLPMSVRTRTGSLLPTTGAAVGVYDEGGNFIGADVILSSPSTVSVASGSGVSSKPDHSDVLKVYVQASMDEVQRLKTKTFLQAYVITQVDILQVLLARMGGPQMRNTFERLINDEAARRGQTSAMMSNGYIEFTTKTMHFSGYGNLLRVAVNYAIDALGKRIVGKEMQEVDRHVEPGLLQLVSQLDVRAIFSE